MFLKQVTIENNNLSATSHISYSPRCYFILNIRRTLLNISINRPRNRLMVFEQSAAVHIESHNVNAEYVCK